MNSATLAAGAAVKVRDVSPVFSLAAAIAALLCGGCAVSIETTGSVGEPSVPSAQAAAPEGPGASPGLHLDYRGTAGDAAADRRVAAAALAPAPPAEPGRSAPPAPRVAVYVGTLPDGVAREGEGIRILPGYEHRVIGAVRVEGITRGASVLLLTRLAVAAGGDAVVAVHTPAGADAQNDPPGTTVGFVLRLDPRVRSRQTGIPSVPL